MIPFVVAPLLAEVRSYIGNTSHQETLDNWPNERYVTYYTMTNLGEPKAWCLALIEWARGRPPTHLGAWRLTEGHIATPMAWAAVPSYEMEPRVGRLK